MYILGISFFYHESAVALIKDGKIIVASAEERFSRKKHDSGFPEHAVTFCLEQAGISSKDLDYVVFYEKPFKKFERNLILSLKYFPTSYSVFVDSMRNFLTEKLWVKTVITNKLRVASDKVLFVPHHLSHAAASYYTSPFSKSAFLTLDGVGEWTTGSFGYGTRNKMYPMGELKFPHSVGLLYATFTAFLGFEVNDGEYKVMGMGAYGKSSHISKVKKLYEVGKDGSIKLNLEYFTFHKNSNGMYSKKFVQLFKDCNIFDTAASLQMCTEEIVFGMLSHIHKKTGQENIVLGGGVALNSVLNAKILKSTPFKNIFIFPASGDDGGAVGSALYVYHHVLGFKKRVKFDGVFLGKDSTEEQIKTLIKKQSLSATKMSDDKLIDFVSEKISEGKVVGWFEGRAEFGPRALGHRSILADPRDKKMKDIVNSKIKFREEFRPFAPVILEEKSAEYFDITSKNLSPFMLGAFNAKSSAKKIHQQWCTRMVHREFKQLERVMTENLGSLFKPFIKKQGFQFY